MDKNILTAILAVAAVFVLAYYGAGYFDFNAGGSSEIQQNQPAEKTAEIGPVVEILKNGEGKEAKAGDKVSVHYTGRFENGEKFDSSLDRGQPFEFTLGAGQVIEGWDVGVLGMKIGEKRKLTIPYDLAYGEAGVPGVIPPKATLVFEIELLDIK